MCLYVIVNILLVYLLISYLIKIYMCMFIQKQTYWYNILSFNLIFIFLWFGIYKSWAHGKM